MIVSLDFLSIQKDFMDLRLMPFDKSKRTKSRTVEDLYCNVRRFFEEEIKDDEFGIYVVDS